MRVLRGKTTACIKKWTDKTRPHNMHIIDTRGPFRRTVKKELREFESDLRDHRRGVHPSERVAGRNMARQIREFCVQSVRGCEFHGICTEKNRLNGANCVSGIVEVIKGLADVGVALGIVVSCIMGLEFRLGG